ncbi:MAG: hypothetical protein IT285_02105 [Bdellovibrionales bacterium]|nr:hypothetical protein [Bdellovibrionales bacterium]
MSLAHPQLATALEASQAAARFLKQRFGSSHVALSREGRDLKLQIDREAEALALEVLAKATSFPVLAEESGLSGAVDTGALPGGPVWIVDPLDGTFNYDRGLPLCCVSIALWENGAPVLGVVQDFCRDEIYSGVVGVGAWLNGKPMRVSGITDSAQAAIATGFPVARGFDETSIRTFITRVQKFKKQRLLGTAALGLAQLAAGRVDVYAEEGGRLWDVAAGVALVLAAGGQAEWVPGGAKPWMGDLRCASTPELYRRLIG